MYDPGSEKLTFSKGLKLKTKGGTELVADSAVWEQGEQKLETEGDVYIKNKSFTLTGQVITAANNFNSIAVTGNVQTNLDQEFQVNADNALFDEEQKVLKISWMGRFCCL